jgi:hypothetical protein
MTQTYPFEIPSGISFIPYVSGSNSLGTASQPFGTVYANHISGTEITSAINALYTGLLNGGVVTLSSPSGINITAGSGRIVDNHTDPTNPTFVNVNWNAFSGIPITYINSAVRSYIGITTSGTIYQKATTDFTPSENREYIELARVIHPNASGQGIVAHTAPAFDSFLNAMDFIDVIGPLNINGNVYSSSGTVLKIQKSEGSTYYPGTNVHNDKSNPNQTTDPLIAPVTIQYRYRGLSGTFITQSNIASIVPGSYDDGTGTLNTGVGNNEYTNQRIYFSFGSNRTIIMYGQAKYGSQSAALAALNSEIFTADPDLANVTSFRGWITLKGNASDLSNSAQAIFTNAGVFGLQSPPSVTTATTDLQTAYSNSTTPEIITDATRDGLTMKEGVGVGLNLYEGQSSDGITRFSVSASGNVVISGTTTVGSSILAATSGNLAIGSAALPFGTIYATALSGVSVGSTASGTNLGSGTGIYSTSVGTLNFKTVSGLGGVTVTNDTNTVYFSGSAGGTFTGGAITSNLTPTNSGTLSLGTAALPFAGMFATQFNSGTVSKYKTNEIPTGAINNVNTTFTLAQTPITDSVQLFVSGVYFYPSGLGTASFNYILSGSTITFVSAPVSGTNIIANYAY